MPALVGRGATGVVLTGSHARGGATGRSDLDLVIVGEGPGYLLRVCDDVLVSEAWAGEEAHRAEFSRPSEVGTSIPGWREGRILYDADGAAGRLKNEAQSWSWEDLCDRADAWVAEELAGFAEEVQKLAASLELGRKLVAAAQRDVLALRLARVLAVHHRLLYGTENVLWEQVGERMGEEWRRAQDAAFGIDGESFEASCAAALSLFDLAADCVASLLDERQAAVVGHARAR
ncbi:MAG TPA: nucleotidyltransferase domain-containing protein [Gaiellaceae bacterium]|nr:nucleotidyltransferase domain-containing protein [Gaiellaceae bacterium]